MWSAWLVLEPPHQLLQQLNLPDIQLPHFSCRNFRHAWAFNDRSMIFKVLASASFSGPFCSTWDEISWTPLIRASASVRRVVSSNASAAGVLISNRRLKLDIEDGEDGWSEWDIQACQERCQHFQWCLEEHQFDSRINLCFLPFPKWNFLNVERRNQIYFLSFVNIRSTKLEQICWNNISWSKLGVTATILAEHFLKILNFFLKLCLTFRECICFNPGKTFCGAQVRETSMSGACTFSDWAPGHRCSRRPPRRLCSATAQPWRGRRPPPGAAASNLRRFFWASVEDDGAQRPRRRSSISISSGNALWLLSSPHMTAPTTISSYGSSTHCTNYLKSMMWEWFGKERFPFALPEFGSVSLKKMAFADEWDLILCFEKLSGKRKCDWAQIGFVKVWRFRLWWKPVIFMAEVEMWTDFHFVIHARMAPASRF